MNILTHQGSATNFIWIAPERTASRATNAAFIHNGYPPKLVPGTTPINFESQYTHAKFIPDSYQTSDYKIIYNTRNPYARVFSVWKIYCIFPNQQIFNVFNRDDESVTAKKAINKIFRRFIINKPISLESVELQSPITPLIPTHTEFSEWVKRTFLKNGNIKKDELNLTRPPDYMVRTENVDEDLLKLPFIKNLPEKIIDNTTYFDEILARTRHHFMASVLKYGDYDEKYYIDFLHSRVMQKVPSNDLLVYEMLTKLYNTLRTDTAVVKSQKIKNIKECFVQIPNFASEAVISDLNEYFTDNFKKAYNEKTAEIVYQANEEWFTVFGYEKDSWK